MSEFFRMHKKIQMFCLSVCVRIYIQMESELIFQKNISKYFKHDLGARRARLF